MNEGAKWHMHLPRFASVFKRVGGSGIMGRHALTLYPQSGNIYQGLCVAPSVVSCSSSVGKSVALHCDVVIDEAWQKDGGFHASLRGPPPKSHLNAIQNRIPFILLTILSFYLASQLTQSRTRRHIYYTWGL